MLLAFIGVFLFTLGTLLAHQSARLYTKENRHGLALVFVCVEALQVSILALMLMELYKKVMCC